MSAFWRWLGMVVLAGLALQTYFLLRIVIMVWMDPQSTSFERSEAWRVSQMSGPAPLGKPFWHQQSVPYAAMASSLKLGVIASEDTEFASHKGFEWESMERAWHTNARAQEQVARQNAVRAGASGKARVKIVGGSTITQQLAKNLFLSGERSFLRKGQELVLTLALEACLSKRRILEIYLNNVEWGAGVFGAEAAAQRYFHKNASQLNPIESARLAVMLPRPKYFEKLPQSDYVANRAEIIAARMSQVEAP